MSELPKALREQQDVRTAVQHYIDGIRAGDSEIMQRAFHDTAVVYGTLRKDGVTQLAGPAYILFDFVDSFGPSRNVRAEFARIDIAGDTANVRLELDKWLGMRCTDFLNLLKTESGWQIVNRVFHQER